MDFDLKMLYCTLNIANNFIYSGWDRSFEALGVSDETILQNLLSGFSSLYVSEVLLQIGSISKSVRYKETSGQCQNFHLN